MFYLLKGDYRVQGVQGLEFMLVWKGYPLILNS